MAFRRKPSEESLLRPLPRPPDLLVRETCPFVPELPGVEIPVSVHFDVEPRGVVSVAVRFNDP